MRKIIYLFLSFLMLSCGTVREVPVQTIEKLIYRDTLIYLHDSIKIEVPYETVKEVIPDIDTSYLKTSFAESVAYLDTSERKIYHTLTQKGEFKTKYDTIIKVQYVEKIVEKDIPVKVEVIKYKRDTLFWVLSMWASICLISVLLKIFILK